MKKYGNKIAAAAAKRKETKVIEMEEPEADDDNDVIDNEEEGGEWINEQNLQRHLIHGIVLPIVSSTNTTEQESIPDTSESQQLQSVPEEVKEEENEDFPAFDEAQLPSLDELEEKKTRLE